MIDVIEVILLLITTVFLAAFFMRARGFRPGEKETENNNSLHKLLQEVVQAVPVGVMIRDALSPQAPIVFVNPAFTAITGYTLEDLKTKPFGFLAGPYSDPEATRRLWKACENGQTSSADVLIYRKDNTPFWSEWHVGPIKEGDRIAYFFSLIMDVSNLRSTQESLVLAKEEAERAGAVKVNFLATISHELRTPINGVLGSLELLLTKEFSGEQKNLINVATSSAQHLLQIVNDILDYSKIEAGTFEIEVAPFSLRGLVKETMDMMMPVASVKNLELKSHIEEDTPDILSSDSGRIRQILLNLLSNAIKFTEQGSVELRVTNLIGGLDSGRHSLLVRFEVIDTGIGIAIEDQKKLFGEFSQVERSFTRRFGGTGLGLAITKQMVKLLNGEVGVESHLGKGSKFWFMVPLEQTAKTPVSKEKHEVLTPDAPTVLSSVQEKEIVNVASVVPVAPSADTTILLVEDNPVNQLVTKKFLYKAGYKVDLAMNGIDAIKKAKENVYDAILMDISMPEMDGITATKEIRALGGRQEEVPIIALTAHVMRGDRERCIAAGMNDYLSKPLYYDAMCNVLARWVIGKEEKKPQKTHVLTAHTSQQKEGMDDIASAMDPFLSTFMAHDPKVLERLARDLDREMVCHIIDVFLKDSVRRKDALLNKLRIGNKKEAAEEAHALKSSAANCGLMQLSELMKRLEYAANDQDTKRVQELTFWIEKVYADGCRALMEARKIYTP